MCQNNTGSTGPRFREVDLVVEYHIRIPKKWENLTTVITPPHPQPPPHPFSPKTSAAFGQSKQHRNTISKEDLISIFEKQWMGWLVVRYSTSVCSFWCFWHIKAFFFLSCSEGVTSFCVANRHRKMAKNTKKKTQRNRFCNLTALLLRSGEMFWHQNALVRVRETLWFESKWLLWRA